MSDLLAKEKDDDESEYVTESEDDDEDFSLPEAVLKRPASNDGADAWKLNQTNKTEEEDASTDDSELEDFNEEATTGRVDACRADPVDLSIYVDNAMVNLTSSDQRNNPMAAQKVLPCVAGDESDNESGSQSTLPDDIDLSEAEYKQIITEELPNREENLELQTYEACICANSSIISKKGPENAEVPDDCDDDTSENDLSDIAPKPVEEKSAPTKKDEDDSGDKSGHGRHMEENEVDRDNVTLLSDVGRPNRRLSLQEALAEIKTPFFSCPETDEDSLDEEDDEEEKEEEGGEEDSCESDVTSTTVLAVSMKDYYSIRHETSCKSEGMHEFILEFNQVESVLDVANKAVSDSDGDDGDDTEDEVLQIDPNEDRAPLERRAIPAIKVSAAKPEHPKAKNEESDTDNEEMLISKEEDSRPLDLAARQDLQKTTEKLTVDNNKEESSEEEDISCIESDLMTEKEFDRAFRNDFEMSTFYEPDTTRLNPKSTGANASESDDEGDLNVETDSCEEGDGVDTPVKSAATDHDVVHDSASLDDFSYDVHPKPRPTFMPVIRLVEMDCLSGTVGILCPDPRSPVRDEVFGIKFNEPNVSPDNTEEISNVSDLNADQELVESGRQTPATEDEVVSDLERDNPHMLLESFHCGYTLPSPMKKIVCHKVDKDGSSKMNEFETKTPITEDISKESEVKSETDEIPVTDDEHLTVSQAGQNVGEKQHKSNVSLKPAVKPGGAKAKKKRRRKSTAQKKDSLGIPQPSPSRSVTN